MALSLRSLAALGLALALAAGGARLLAQESTELNPDDLFASAKAAYGEKRYGATLSDLQLLVGAVSKLRIEQIKPALPAAPAGWKAEDATGESMGAGFAMGAGLTVKREFQKEAPEGTESGSVSIQILLDSPLIGMVAPMISNPAMFQGQEGMSVLNLKGKKALLEWHKDSKNGSVKILLHDNTTLLTIEGSNVQKADLSDTFAKAIDIERLEKILAN